MRRILLGSLVFAALTAGGSAVAVEAGSAPGADKATAVPSTKHTATTKPRKRPMPLSAPIGTTPTTQLPLGPADHAAPPPSTEHSWTGVYVGGGGGIGAGK
ncbi:MAG: hypothetical protein E7813_04035 [Bradyrhizobium sp.]|uniref:hypothetical protein n=1 Tax=Bradyrhizobium sp. TaxID=376 RepID=UPI001222CE1A|nr:hypothetical protein [Bradyrhizobium sp.]THD72441.1 MAG: hypothetical protein E7813_04035 [Bradyrhizobium sp.]